MAQLTDENWLRDLVFLCGISHNLNDLNIKFLGQQELVCDIFGAQSF